MRTHTFSKKHGRITLSKSFKDILSDGSSFAVSGTLEYLKTWLSNSTGMKCFIVNPPEFEDVGVGRQDSMAIHLIKTWTIDGLMRQPARDVHHVFWILETLNRALEDLKYIDACSTVVLDNIKMATPKELEGNGFTVVMRGERGLLGEDECLCGVDIEKTLEESGMKLLDKTSEYWVMKKKDRADVK